MKSLFLKVTIFLLVFLLGCQNKIQKTDQNTSYNDSSNIFLSRNNIEEKDYIDGIQKDSLKFYSYLKKKSIYPFNKIHPFHDIILINNKFELLEFIEPILFRIYSKKTIIGERPYFVYLLGDYWFLQGNLPSTNGGYTLGGVFEITVNRKTCEIIYLIHGK